MYEPRRFMSTNVCSRDIREARRLVLYGTCVAFEHPNLLAEVAGNSPALAVCLEEDHMNMVGFKLAGMLRRCELEELVVLTVDGSPHCVQLHTLVEECVKILGGLRTRVRHAVIYKGRLYEVSAEDVKLSRYLSKISRLRRLTNMEPGGL